MNSTPSTNSIILYPNNNATFRLDFIPSIYFTLCLLDISILITTGSNLFVKPYLVFLFFFILILFSTNALRVLIVQSIRNFGGICLISFLFYYLVMALGYPDAQISIIHTNYIIKTIVPIILIGFTLFGRIDILSIQPFSKFSPLIRSILFNTVTIGALLFSIIQTAFLISIFYSNERIDLFLIKNVVSKTQDLDELPYQSFGLYALLAFIASLKILHYYFILNKDSFIKYCFITFCLVFIYSLPAALLGSIKEPAVMVLISLFSIIYAKPKNYLFKNNKIHTKRFFCVLSIFILSIAGAFFIPHIKLPPLRFFDYQEHLSLSPLLTNQSLTSRKQIMMDTGADQLSINPIFGDLGAEYRTNRPGGYIHSLISVQSHLGIIGTLLLLGYLIHRLYRLYANHGRSVLKMITPPILLIALIGTFFWWPGFWFLIGALFAPRRDR